MIFPELQFFEREVPVLKFVPIMLSWMACTAAFYAFACYFSFEYKRAKDDPISSATFSAVNSKGGAYGTIKAIAIVAIVMTAVLAGIVGLSRSGPGGLTHVLAFFGFYAIFTLLGTLPKKRSESLAIRLTIFFGRIAISIGIVWVWMHYPNWIVGDICSSMLALGILGAVKNVTYRECVAVCLGFMLYDTVGVFVTHQMQAATSVAAPYVRMVTISVPSGLSPSAQVVMRTGLGDLILPGLIILFAYRTYKTRGALGAIAGYLVGMILATVTAVSFNFDQPATIYLMPSAFLGLWLATGRWRSPAIA